MKTKQTESIDIPTTYDPAIEPGMAELTTELNGHPFIVRGDEEGVRAEAERILAEDTARMARKPAVSHVEAPKTVSSPQPEYLSLATLDERTAARMALKAFKHDILTFGRTKLYREFKTKLHAEQDLQARMELGIVDAVHCRLHERVVAKARGVR